MEIFYNRINRQCMNATDIDKKSISVGSMSFPDTTILKKKIDVMHYVASGLYRDSYNNITNSEVSQSGIQSIIQPHHLKGDTDSLETSFNKYNSCVLNEPLQTIELVKEEINSIDNIEYFTIDEFIEDFFTKALLNSSFSNALIMESSFVELSKSQINSMIYDHILMDPEDYIYLQPDRKLTDNNVYIIHNDDISVTINGIGATEQTTGLFNNNLYTFDKLIIDSSQDIEIKITNISDSKLVLPDLIYILQK